MDGRSAGPGSERGVSMLLWFVAGLALFLFGLHALSLGLRHGAGRRAKRLMHTLTGSHWRGLLTGVAVTGLIQSSSATNVMVVGLVRAGLLDLSQAIRVMLGANIGTTVTAQLIALDLSRWAPTIVAVGAVVYAASVFAPAAWNRRLRYGGGACIGLGALLLGMEMMRLGLAPVAATPVAQTWLTRLAENPYLAVMAGALLTSIVQSSSVTTGMTMVMADTGLIHLSGALGIVLGANIGTVVTTLIASIGGSLDGRRAAVADLIFNVVGVALFIPFLSAFTQLVSLMSVHAARQVAHGHALFNIITALAVVPFVPQLAAAVVKLVPGRPGKD